MICSGEEVGLRGEVVFWLWGDDLRDAAEGESKDVAVEGGVGGSRREFDGEGAYSGGELEDSAFAE